MSDVKPKKKLRWRWDAIGTLISIAVWLIIYWFSEVAAVVIAFTFLGLVGVVAVIAFASLIFTKEPWEQ